MVTILILATVAALAFGAAFGWYLAHRRLPHTLSTLDPQQWNALIERVNEEDTRVMDR